MPIYIEKQLQTIKGISRLTYADEELFRLSFPKDSVQYVRSFLYLLRASHGEDGSLGFKYTSNNLIAVIGFRNKKIYVTPIIDVSLGSQLQELCQKVATITATQVFIKKYSPQAYPHIKSVKSISSKAKVLEDDAYPETVLNLQRLFSDMNGKVNSSAAKFSKQLRRFNRLGITYEIAERITAENLPKIMTFLKKDPDKYSNYLPVINYLYKYGKKIRYKVMIFLHNDEVEGVYIVEFFSLTDSGLYCAVTAKNRPGITEWMDWYFFKMLYNEGVKNIYFGGSETKGVAYYIKKLNPINPSYFVETVQFDYPIALNRIQNELKQHTQTRSKLKKMTRHIHKLNPISTLKLLKTPKMLPVQ